MYSQLEVEFRSSCFSLTGRGHIYWAENNKPGTFSSFFEDVCSVIIFDKLNTFRLSKIFPVLSRKFVSLLYKGKVL